MVTEVPNDDTRDVTASDAFSRILESIKSAQTVSQLKLTEVEAPKKLARFSVAIDGVLEPNLATGKFIVMFDPKGDHELENDIRVIAFFEADYELEKILEKKTSNTLIGRFENQLELVGAKNITGNVSCSYDRHFGNSPESLLDPLDGITTSEVSVRISWSTDDTNLLDDLIAWEKMIHFTVGIDYPVRSTLSAI
ncbi:MAG: DUF3000 family protein [Candidatus Ancillula sp.]|jgi:hypothetical protein|nr:DUF3000 family protein [Candidatus Ancillula sp.]